MTSKLQASRSMRRSAVRYPWESRFKIDVCGIGIIDSMRDGPVVSHVSEVAVEARGAALLISLYE